MKTICLYFEIHQIIHLKRYRFFDIGTDHYYYDDFENERSISDIAERSYMPALNAFQEMIRDNGKGIGKEELPFIFERFYRTDSSRNSRTGGSGLGLAIAKKIMDEHGGRIWAESELGKGTEVYFTLKK